MTTSAGPRARTRIFMAVLATIVAVAGLWSTPALAFIEGWNPMPDRVLGQPSLSDSPECNRGGISAGSLCFARGVAVDAAGNVYVADWGNARVLEYDTPWAPGGDTVADRVFGQPDFSTGSRSLCNGRSASTFCSVDDVAVDGEGNLYVVDYNGSRVLEFDNPLAPGGDNVADRVLGQPTLTTTICNNGGVSANSLCYARHIAVDAAGNVYVADGNQRVLEYDNPVLTNDVTADRVFRGLHQADVDVDPEATHLVVMSAHTFSVFAYDDPLTTDNVADHNWYWHGCYYGAMDASMNLFCGGGYRVEGFLSPFSTDQALDILFSWEFGVPPRVRYSVAGISTDGTGSLYVSDGGRVVVFSPPLFPPDTDGDGVYDFRDPCPLEAPRLGLDADEDGCTDTIAGLKRLCISLQEQGYWPGNWWNGAEAKLDEAQKALDHGNTRPAVRNLHNFIDQVQNHMCNGCAPPEEQLLVSYAQNVITLISQ